ncbi:DUF7507 domain-containing protein [Saccharopolyspora flava]|nr:DUF11 domain-containing protein [Saccharopolyspora flava]
MLLTILQIVDRPEAQAAPPAGYVSVPAWDGADAAPSTSPVTTTLPNNGAALGPVTAVDSSPASTDLLDTSAATQFNIDGQVVPRVQVNSTSVPTLGDPCIANKPVDQINQCSAHYVTVNLPRAVVDPVIAIRTSGGYRQTGDACNASWLDTAVSRVNGATTTSGSTSVVGGSLGNYAYNSTTNRLSLTQSYIAGLACNTLPTNATDGSAVYLQLKGVVTSFELTDYFMTSALTQVTTTAAAISGRAMFNLYVPQSDLAITKTGPATAVNGGLMQWTINATNNGAAPSHGFVINDAVPAGVTGASLVSAPPGCSLNGTSLVCSAAPPNCTVAQNTTSPTWADLTCANPQNADASVLDPGASFGPIILQGNAPVTGSSVTNTASIAGVDSDPATGNNTASVTTTLAEAPGLSLVKTADPTTVTAAGQQVGYSYEVTNTGDVPLGGLALTETQFTGSGTPPDISCPTTNLNVGASTTCTATYTTTQADIDRGSVLNAATATASTAGGGVATSPEAAATVTATRTPGLALTKTAAPTSISAAGQPVNYTFAVTNTGNVTVSGLTINETQFSGSPTPAVTCPVTSLAPGASTNCTATYTSTQDDVNRGFITNEANASGTTTAGPIASAPSSARVDIAAEPSLALVKTADPATAPGAGAQVTFHYDVTNTGNVTMSGIAVTDTEFTGTGMLPPVTCPQTTLLPGQSTSCTTTYTITPADADAGGVSNTATAVGTIPAGQQVPSNPSSATVIVPATGGPTLVKTADPATVTNAGQSITYSYAVTNDSNVTLNGVSVADTEFTGTGPAPMPSCPVTTLAPGTSTTCTATYAATQADIDRGSIANTAQAVGTVPNGEQRTSAPASAVVDAPAAPALELTKTAAPQSIDAEGDQVTYTFLVRNTGNVTMSGVAVAETSFSGTGTPPVPACPGDVLAPGAEMTCTATYTATQADLDAGTITNAANATGTPPGTNEPINSAISEAAVDVAAAPALSIVKSVDKPTPQDFYPGSLLTYSFVVTNTGNVTMGAVTVNDTEFTGTGTLSRGPARRTCSRRTRR